MIIFQVNRKNGGGCIPAVFHGIDRFFFVKERSFLPVYTIVFGVAPREKAVPE